VNLSKRSLAVMPPGLVQALGPVFEQLEWRMKGLSSEHPGTRFGVSVARVIL
jgi:hypothetical protein